jgi:hypothetical protein
MNPFTNLFHRQPPSVLHPPSPVPGLYHYARESEHEKSRIHLRLDADGNGTLIVNANRVMHLNPTAALMAYLALEEVEEREAVKTVQQKYRVSASQARADLSEFRIQISELLRRRQYRRPADQLRGRDDRERPGDFGNLFLPIGTDDHFPEHRRCAEYHTQPFGPSRHDGSLHQRQGAYFGFSN